MTTKPKKTGRPKKLNKISLDDVRRLASRGLTYEQIAKSLGICRKTLQERCKDTEGFLEAIEEGRAQGIVEVSNKLYEQALDGNTTAMIFYLKTRAGWTEKQELTIGGNGTPVKHEISATELKGLPYEKLIQLAGLANSDSENE